MLNDQQQERVMRLWAESQQAVVNYLHATVRDPAAAKALAQETALVLLRRFSAEIAGRNGRVRVMNGLHLTVVII